jgi:hypothetical protein
MKMKLKIITLSLLVIVPTVHADVVAQWNFNGTFDLVSPAPSTGSGNASRLNGVSGASVTGSANDSGASPTNFAWNTSAYPPQGTSNKTSGVQFAVNTTGYTNIGVSWDTQDSNTGSRYTRLQYTTNGSTFIDYAVNTNTTSTTTKTNSFVGVPGVDNNPNFAIRVVTEWEFTAIGTGLNIYTNANAPTGSYSPNGTIRYDLVTIWGTLFGTLNTPPVISVLTNQTTRSGQATNQAFTIGDAETVATSLVVTSICNNTTLVPNGNIIVTSTDGSGSNRLVTVTPAAGEIGTATITLFVVDGGTFFASRSYTLTVLPLNTPPTITGLVNTNTLVNTPVTIPFTVGDAETAAGSLTLSSSSAYPSILPPGGISFGGSGANRTVTITPALNQTGVAVATVTVSDGSLTTNITFSVMVTPTPSFIFYEPFSYSDGQLVGLNTGNLWQHHSGAITGEVQVAGGSVTVDEIFAEDVSARLIGAPYYSTNAGGIYTKVVATVNFLPTLSSNTPFGTYFLHLKDDGTVNFRTRVIVTVTNAAAGTYRFAIANGTSTNAPDQFAADLTLGVPYTIVTRYDLVSGLSTLWVNPTAETDPSVTATDPVNLNLISGVALRQAIGIGQVVVDDLIVAKTFNAALGNTSTPTNTPPVIFPVANVLAASGEATAPITVTIGDAETAAGSLNLTAVSSNQTLLPNANIVYGGSGSNRTLTLTPVLGQLGSTIVFVSVTDGVFTNQATFTVSVNPALLLSDSFSYPNGSLVTNSGSLFTNFSGTAGDMIVSNGVLALTFSRSEDAAAPLTNSPYAPASGVILYAGMTLNFSALPSGSYFAFFKDTGTTFRGKIFGTTSGAAPGSFRFAVMNTGSTLDATNPVFAADIPTNTSHRVILRYEVATGLSTLWVDPASESDPSITGNDFAGPATISTFAFRQASGMGTMTLDDLLVGTTFQAVLGDAPRPRLTILRTGDHSLSLSWPTGATGYSLISATNNPAGPYGTYPDQGVTQGSLRVVNITASTGTIFFQLKK